jgi:glycine cleavage system H protein
MFPDDVKYTESHEWVRIEDVHAIIGITDYAQDNLGEITYVDFPDIGKQVDQFGELGVIESVKTASDIYSPLGGIVVQINDILEESPETINKDPFGDGWICQLEDFKRSALKNLMSAREYELYLKGQKKGQK